MKSTEGLGVCSRRDSAHASASLDGGVSDIIVTCVHQSLHSSLRRRLESRNDLSSVTIMESKFRFLSRLLKVKLLGSLYAEERTDTWIIYLFKIQDEPTRVLNCYWEDLSQKPTNLVMLRLSHLLQASGNRLRRKLRNQLKASGKPMQIRLRNNQNHWTMNSVLTWVTRSGKISPPVKTSTETLFLSRS